MRKDEKRRKAVMRMLTADGMLEVLNGRYDDLNKVNDTTVVFRKGTDQYGCRMHGSFDGGDLPVLETYATVFLCIPDSMQAHLGRDQDASEKVTNIKERSFDRDSVSFEITYEQMIEFFDTADTLRASVEAGVKAIEDRKASIASWVNKSRQTTDR